MANLLAQLTTVMGSITTQIGTVCETIIEQPLLLMTVGFLFFGGCIGIVGRLLSRN